MPSTLNRLIPASLICVALAATGCAHLVSFGVVATDTGQGREFDYDPGTTRLTAGGSDGEILRLWLKTKDNEISSDKGRVRREIPAGCMGGFLFLNEGLGKRRGRLAVILCPREGAPAGWSSWSASLEEQVKVSGEHQIPASVTIFNFQPSAAGDELLVTTENSKLKAALPPGPNAFFRRHPELLAFTLVTGIVPASHAGTYEVKEN